MSKIKKMVIINTIIIFVISFPFHQLYKWIPNNIIALLFPVNESLFEHLKLIFITPIIVGVIMYFIYRNRVKLNSYFGSLYLTVMVNIISFYAIFLPIYYRIGEKMIVVFVVYLFSIIISQYVNYLVLSKVDNNCSFNIIGIALLVINSIIFAYLTFKPLHNDFFFDSNAEKYGINEYIKTNP